MTLVIVDRRPIQAAIRVTIPVLAAHLPLGIVFGLLVQQAGYGWHWGFLSSLLIYGGSLQFLSLSLLAAGSSLGVLLLTALPVAARNSFYGLSVLERFQGHWLRRGYLAFGLVDSTYSILTANDSFDGENDQVFCFWVTVLGHVYWVVGTLIGVATASLLPDSIAELEFVITSMFVLFALEQYLKNREVAPFVIALFALALALLLAPQYLLLVSIVLSALALTAWEARR